MKITKILWNVCLALIVNSVFDMEAEAATIKAANCSLNAVQYAINSASHGDTVIVPNGNCSWSSGINTSKQIKIRGELKGSVNLTLSCPSCTELSGGFVMFAITTGTSYKTEISNINFLTDIPAGTHNTNSKYITVSGAATDKPPLIYDNYFNVPNYSIYMAVNYLRYGGGVIYSNVFESTENACCATGPCGTVGGNCGSWSPAFVVKAGESSAISWSTPSTMGMDDTTGLNNIYFEDNTINNLGTAIDCDDGARMVIRNNKFNNSSFTCHGADTSWYGVRHVELYDNEFNFNASGTWTLSGITGYYPLNLQAWWGNRGGTGVITGNIMPDIKSGLWGNKPEVLLQVQQIDRKAGPDPCCSLYPCFHQIGRGQDNRLEPMYIWGNTGTGLPESPSIAKSGYGECGGGGDPNDYIQVNREYFVQTAKPGWKRFTYPHPLTLLKESLLAPSELRIVQ